MGLQGHAPGGDGGFGEAQSERLPDPSDSLLQWLVTLAGALTLLAVPGKFYATTARAQAMRAAFVQNVDEKGRSPYIL